MVGNKINLRTLLKEDAKTTWEWRNKGILSEYYSGHPFYIDLKDEEAWIEKISDSNIPLTSFGIEEKVTNILVGISFLKDINLINRTCEFAIFMGDESDKRKDYAKEVTLKTMEFAFRDLELNRISLIVQEDNEMAINLYKKCGYQTEGLLRESVRERGEYKNEIIMSVVRKEFIKLYDFQFAGNIESEIELDVF